MRAKNEDCYQKMMKNNNLVTRIPA